MVAEALLALTLVLVLAVPLWLLHIWRRNRLVAETITLCVEGRTPGGFIIPFEITAGVQPREGAKASLAELTGGQSRHRLVQDLYSYLVMPLLGPGKAACFTFRIDESGQVGVGLTQHCFRDSADERLSSEECFLKLVNKLNGDTQWLTSFYTFKWTRLRALDEPEMVKEFYNMLSPAEKASAEQSPAFERAREAIAIAALKLRHDLLLPSQTVRSEGLTIAMTVIDRGVRIEWQLSESWLAKGAELCGYRKSGGFCPDPKSQFSETENGTQIIHSRANGSMVDHGVPGDTMYYTFFLRGTSLLSDDLWRRNAVRLSAHIPKDGDLGTIRKLLESSRATRSADEKEREHRDRILNRINFAVERQELLISYRRRKVAEVEANPKYSDEERRQIIQAINDEVDDAAIPLHS